MDVKAVSQVVFPTVNQNTGGSSGTSMSTASIRLSAQASRFIESVSANERLAPVERQALVETSAMIEQYAPTPDARQVMYRDLVGMGIYLSESSTESYPRWSVLTGLRYFSGQAYELTGASETVSSGNGLEVVSERLDQIAREFRRATPQQVKQTLAKKPPEHLDRAIAQTLGHAVQMTNDGVDVPDGSQPQHVTIA